MGLFKRIIVDKQEQPVTTKQKIATRLSQRDPIEKLNLMEHSFNALTHAGVQIVGQLLKLVESGEIRAIHGLRSTSILEIEVKLAQLEIADNSEVEANPNATPDQNDVPLSREVPVEKSSLIQPPPTQLHTDNQAVGEIEEQVKSSESPIISEGDANMDTMPDQNDAFLLQEDAPEEPSSPQHSPNPLIHTENHTVGEVTQHVESTEIQTTSEAEANIDTTPDQSAVSLSQEDSIERLSLTRHTLNLLKHTDIQTVGDLLQWFESGRLQTIPALGRISILEIEDELARMNPLDDIEGEANSGVTPDQNDVSFSRVGSIEESSLPQHSPNLPIHTESQAVGEDTQHVESAEIQTIAEAEVNVDTIPDQNDVSLSQEDATEELSLPQHSPNPPIHTESQAVGESTQHIESSELQTISEAEADTNETPDQKEVSLSQEDSTKKITLNRDALNRLKQTDVRTVGQLLQWVESGKSQAIAEGEADANETSDQNDVPLSREDATEEQSLTEHSPNPLIDTDSQAVGEVAQHVESSEIQTITEGEADTNETSDQHDVPLSREDPIEKLRLTQYALNRLKQTDVRTVGQLLQWVESDTTPALGQKFISKIKERLAPAKTLDDPETEAKTNEASDQNDVSLSREDSTEEQNLTQHTDLQTVREDEQQIESTDTVVILDQNDTHLSRGDAIEKLNLSRPSFDVLTRIGIRTVGEVLQLFESARLNMIRQAFGSEFASEIRTKLAQVTILDDSETEANTNTTPDQNDISLSQEDSTKEQSLTEHSPNPFIDTDSQTVEEDAQQVESGEYQTTSEIEANTDATLSQDDVSLSREDSIEKLNLTEYSFNALTALGVQTVGEVLNLVESGKHRPISTLGRKFILEIEDKLAQVKLLDDYETEANTNAMLNQDNVSLSQKDLIEEPRLTQHSSNQLHIESQTVGETAQHVESAEIQTSSEAEAHIDVISDHGDPSLSGEDATEEPSLPQRSPNPPIQTEGQTVGRVEQQVEPTEPPTTSEGEANTNATPSQNDIYLSRGDTIEKLSLSQRSLKVLKRADIRLVGELLPRVESGKIRVTRGLGRKPIAEIEEKLAQVKVYDNYAQLSREDSIGQLYLRNRSFNALTRAGIRTVGEALQLVESSRLETIHGLGRKSILEIKNKLAQVTTLNDSEVEIAADPQAEEHSTISVESQGENNMGIQPGFQSNSEENSTAPGEDEADAKLTETKPQSDSQTDAALRKTWEEIFKITERLAQVKTIQNTLFLREDPIEKMNLSKHSLNAFKHIGIRTVGDALHLIKSIRLKTIRDIGAKCILEIMEILSQGKIFYDSEARWLSSRMWKGLTVKILNDAEVEIKRRKDEIPNRVVRWQSELVGKQLSKGLLHEDAIIVERSIKEWLSETKTIEDNHVYEVLATILGSSLNICEEIEFFLNQIPGQYRIPVLLSKYGFEAKNLAQTGAELGISRERVRQIRNELKDKVTSLSNLQTKPNLLRMQSALFIAGDLGLDITYEKWAQRIRSSGLVGNWTSQEFVNTDTVETMIAIYNLLADCEIHWLQMPQNLQYAVQLAAEGKPNVPAKTLHAVDTLSDEIRRLINRHTKFSGGVYARWLSQEMEMELEEVTDILKGLGYKALSKGWFTPHQISYSDAFHRCLHKMFQYCGSLGIDDICAGIRHGVSRSGYSEPEYLANKGTVQSRSVFPVPPPDVVAEILRVSGYQRDDELYSWTDSYDEKLSKGETIIMNCLEQTGPVLHHTELIQAFIESDLSVPSLHATLKRTPLFHTIEFGLYKLRGKEVTYQDIERAKAAGKPQSLRPEIEYDIEGNIIVSVTLSTIAVGSGTILCERFPDLSGAGWECYVDSERAGELSAVENEFRRLKKPFELLNCQPGERVKFTFNTWERKVTIEKEGLDAEN